MDYERKYKKALALARDYYKANLKLNNEDENLILGDIFPELAMSEDERIRKEIVRFIQMEVEDEIVGNKWIAWLEKQGEQKEYTFKSIPRLLDMIEPTDRAKSYCQKLIDSLLQEGYATDAKIVGDCLKQMKGEKVGMATMDEQKPQGKTALEAINEVEADNANKIEPKDYNSIDPHFAKPIDKIEPKFKVGDWIIHQGTGNIYQVVAVIDNQYQLRYGDNTIQKCTDVDKCARLWNVTKDAKDGDVLVSGEVIFIFNKIHDVWINCHCSLHRDGSFIGEDYDLMTVKYGEEVYPATKEQRNLLFSKMRESGYEWNAEKKEMKKVEDEPKNYKQQVMSEMTDLVKDYIKQNPAWSEEDAYRTSTLTDVVKSGGSIRVELRNEYVDWLKSLKGRIQY